jgi:hypothetical protein
MPIRPGEVGGGGHCGHVALTVGRLHRNTRQLPIGNRDSMACHCITHATQLVGAGLVAEAAESTVDHHDDHPLGEAERLRRHRVLDPVDELHLEEVAARPQRAEPNQCRHELHGS